MKNFEELLEHFTPISLKEMDNVKLLNRADTKFVFNATLLPEILEEIASKYSVLTTPTGKINHYRTLYFDTEKLHNYIGHHNGKLNRVKIRFREYIDSKLIYFEIKLKNNKGKTIKSRMKNPAIEKEFSEITKTFVEAHSPFKSEDIKPVLWNSFSRITLVHKIDKERLTLDINISFSNVQKEKNRDIPHLIIAEVKQEKMSVNSDFIQLMKKKHIRQSSISKYCVGTVLLNDQVKKNKFKELISNIEKLQQ